VIRPCVSSQSQPHDVVGASRDANREGSGAEGGGYGQGGVRLSPPKGEKIKLIFFLTRSYDVAIL
jgi:hypothetical protein